MELTQLFSIDEWSAIESDIYGLYKLQGSVFNTDGVRITQTQNWSNPLCPAIKSTDKGQSYICAVAHMNMAKQAMADGGRSNQDIAVIEECDAGMLKLVVPIFYKNEFLGVLGGCGLLTEGGKIEHFAINKITEIPKAQIDLLSARIPLITHEKAQSACSYIQDKLDRILTDFKNRQPV